MREKNFLICQTKSGKIYWRQTPKKKLEKTSETAGSFI